MYKTTLTTRDHMLNVDEARSMYDIGSLEEKIIAISISATRTTSLRKRVKE